MNLDRTRVVIVALVAVLAGAGGYYALREAPPRLQGTPLGAVREPSPMMIPSALPQSQNAAAAATEPAKQREARAKARYAQVDRWMRSGTAEDALRAHQATHACIMARGLEVDRAEAVQGADEFRKSQHALLPTADEACLGLTPGQIAASSRLLVQAGEAGLHDAYVAAYGLSSQDAAVGDAFDRIELAAIDKGDVAALTSRAQRISNRCQARTANCTPEQLGEALTYRTAAIRILTEQGKPPPATYNDTSTLVARVGDAQKAAAAIARGEELARTKGGVR